MRHTKSRVFLCKIDLELHTSGTGSWSHHKASVRHRVMKLYPTSDARGEYGELRVYFDKRDWNTEKDGLIYTDPGWLRELRAGLNHSGFHERELKGREVDYSEQGMQGDNFVSLDVGPKFVHGWRRLGCK